MKTTASLADILKRYQGSSVRFTASMVMSAFGAVFWLFVVLAIVARLDVAFFEANGMAQNADIREAFYYQVFQFEAIIPIMILCGFAAVIFLSVLFCKSQYDYFKHLAAALRLMADSSDSPPTALLGRFNPFATYFFEILSRRLNGETEEGLDSLLTRASKEWPNEPRISWMDQLHFAAISGLLGMFFSAFCVMVYLKVSGRVVELAGTVVHFTSPNGPSFLQEQFTIVNNVVTILLILTVFSFIRTGYRFGCQISEADYAILRDLKDFMEGNFRKRVFLRARDPAAEHVESMNKSLERIAEKLRAVRSNASAQDAGGS